MIRLLTILIPVMIGGVLIWLLTKPACACTTKTQARVAALRSDLRFAADSLNARFAAGRHGTVTAEGLGTPVSTGVRLLGARVHPTGWWAAVAHEAGPACGMFVGSDPPPFDVGSPVEGQPFCVPAR